jgi:hypothetical protein
MTLHPDRPERWSWRWAGFAGTADLAREIGAERPDSVRCLVPSSGLRPTRGLIVVSMQATERKVIRTPHARVWSGAIFGSVFLASYMALAENHPPVPDLNDPVGAAFCLLALA